MGIGKNINRVDALSKVRGTTKYTEDLIPHNALTAKILHSKIANGIVKDIDISEALKIEGVMKIVTCFDVPDTDFSTAGHPYSLDPTHADIKDRKLLNKRIRYYGDDVAVVVAIDQIAAQKALEAIKVNYEQFEPRLNVYDNKKIENPLHEFYPDDVMSRMDFYLESDNKAIFKNHKVLDELVKNHSIEGNLPDSNKSMKKNEYTLPIVQHAHIENIVCFAYMEGKRHIVVSATQVPHVVRRIVSEALKIAIGDVQVIKPYIGGGFGNKQDIIYEPLAMYLSKLMGGVCISLILSREETFINSRTRHGMKITTMLNTEDNSLRMQNRAASIISNQGAYSTHGHAIAANAITNYFQMYSGSGMQFGSSVSKYSNLPSAAAMRAYGIPQICFATESQMDDYAREAGFDPIEFRIVNLAKIGDVEPFNDIHINSNGLVECINKGKELISWDDKKKKYEEFNINSKDFKKGIGIALFAYKTGVYPITVETSSCRIILNQDGSLQVQVGAIEIGQGSDTAFCQIASEILSIPEDKINIVSCQDTDISPFDPGAYASRQTYIGGGAVKKAAVLLKKKILEKAVNKLGISFKELDLIDEYIIRKSDGEKLEKLENVILYSMYSLNNTEHLTAEATYTGLNNAFAYGACFADICVDIPLGKIEIYKMYSIHDSGKIINPQLAEAQVHGAVAMGVGYAIGEEMLFDKISGKPLNNNFLDYKIPTSMDIPEIEVAFVETYEPSGPFGNKALGEPPIIAPAPAIRNAVLFATGVSINSLPLNPQKLVSAFKEANLIDEE
ncbi:MAG: xanthine dehydrogenase molybdenum-binding subunit XdhA [Firmicutes bacterium]|nr:xanthine dehydrogenase molybdenum-binding subunit XdhA [Bacillota bacterium]